MTQARCCNNLRPTCFRVHSEQCLSVSDKEHSAPLHSNAEWNSQGAVASQHSLSLCDRIDSHEAEAASIRDKQLTALPNRDPEWLHQFVFAGDNSLVSCGSAGMQHGRLRVRKHDFAALGG